MKPEKKNNAEDKPPVLKEEAIALAKAGDLPGALAAANTIEDAKERAAALEAIATATAEQEQAPPVVDVAQKRRDTNTGVGIGFFFQVIGFFALRSEIHSSGVGIALILLSLPPFIWGCMNYAESKGYHKEVGLIGLLGIIGLIVLVVLPDKFQSLMPVPRMRKIVGWISLMLGIALIVWGFGARSWLQEKKNSYANWSLEQQMAFIDAKSGYWINPETGDFERLSWYNRLLYRKDTAASLIFFGGWPIVASLVMLGYRRKKPQQVIAHET